MNKAVIFESPTIWHKWLIMLSLRLGHKVWVIEPFHAYHHKEKRKAIFYPRALPAYIWEYIKTGKVSLLKAESLSPKDIYPRAADQALAIVEAVYPEYIKAHGRMIGYLSKTLNTQKVEDVFRKRLCDQIARFYSQNIMFHRIGKLFAEKIVLYPERNILEYSHMKSLLVSGGHPINDNNSLIIAPLCYLSGFRDGLRIYLTAILRLALQTLASGALPMITKKQPKKKRDFLYGIAVLGDRQLRDNKRRADFMVDGEDIRKEEVVFLPLVSLKSGQKDQLSKMRGNVFYPPSNKRNFSNFPSWAGLLWIALRENILRNSSEIEAACLVLAEYFRWKIVLRSIGLKHFITNCDFSVAHIARNIALKEFGIKTWYFIDSMNMSGNFSDDTKGLRGGHPFWTYLYYDNLVAWDDFIGQYFKGSHNSIDQVHNIGCLWSDNVSVRQKTGHDQRVIAAFDTTYTYNSFTSYREGIEYARHLLRLIEELPDLLLYMKEKKADDAAYHATLDPINSPELLSLYKRMYRHPRIKKYTNQADAADIMSGADVIISFPFTSTTFEALAANKPAVWHDPMGYYRNTPYARAGGVTTHSYDELKRKVLEIMGEKGEYENPMPNDSPLMDPYRDGKAIERFRDLLSRSRQPNNEK